MTHQNLGIDIDIDNLEMLDLSEDLELQRLEEEMEIEDELELVKSLNSESAEIVDTCRVLASTYPKRFRRLVSPEEEERQRALNSPAIIRSHFQNYLRTEFPYSQNWVHPTTRAVFDHQYIKSTIEEYKYYSPGYYRALWALWTTQGTRAFISENFNYSGSTIRRRWDKGIDTILLLLLFPSLKVQDFKLFSRDS